MSARDASEVGKRGESLAERAYRGIKQGLLDFHYLPSERLSETELAQTLELSRTPVRQALQRLEHEGYVESNGRQGWVAMPIRFERIDALYDFRTLIECFAVRVCCASDGPRAQLRELLDIWQAPHPEAEHAGESVRALDERFHRALVAMAGNPEISRTHDEITDKIRIVRRLDFTKQSRIDATYAEHLQILAAIERRRTAEGERLLSAHIEHSKIEVRKITLDMLYQARQARAG